MKNPHLIEMFPTLAAEFPNGQITDPDKFRENSAIQRHGAGVIMLIDQMIMEFDNPQKLKKLIRTAVEKHMNIKTRGMKGNYFAVCFKFITLQQIIVSAIYPYYPQTLGALNLVYIGFTPKTREN